MRDGIKFKGFKGTWHILAQTSILGINLVAWESDQWGEDIPGIITDDKDKILVDSVYNGWSDYREKYNID